LAINVLDMDTVLDRLLAAGISEDRGPGAFGGRHSTGRRPDGSWRGIAGDGHGRLRSRRVQVRVADRGGIAHRRRKASVLLPGPAGAVAKLGRADTAATVGSVPAPRERRAG
jgi:hypothetical protein